MDPHADEAPAEELEPERRPRGGNGGGGGRRRSGGRDDLEPILDVLLALRQGDFTQRVPERGTGVAADIARAVNSFVDQLRDVSSEVIRVAREVGSEGKLGAQAEVRGVTGTFRELTDHVNMLAGNLTGQVRNIAAVTTAVANGDLSRQISVDAKGEILELKNTINGMVEQLRTFAREVTRVAREVGTEGKLGGQAQVPGVAGTWKDLTDNVNGMASNLTSQVRGIVRVVTAVANGDLSRKLTVATKGEIAALAETINDMTDTLRTFAGQVTTVAREVGIEGKLGGQAMVPGAAGTWRDLTENVNRLAGNLTTQVRAISEVATSVIKGDLTRTIDVAAQGEVLALKDTLNQMIANLRDTTRTNKEQDWLKSNLARFTGMMQGQRSLKTLADLIMSELTPSVSAQVGTFYVGDEAGFQLLSTYGYVRRKHLSNRFVLGEGLVGQCALEKQPILVEEVPDDYVHVSSSLGEAAPSAILVLPIVFGGQVRAVMELGSFRGFSPIQVTFLEQVTLSIGVVINMIAASTRTEELLNELQRSNAELGSRTRELEEKARQLEDKNREIAETSANLEEKARQLSMVSRYKSEFLANMSHELRTPLNAMLILANLLSDNPDGNLSARQVEFARTIHASGRDLLTLISQILDLSKIEAGRMTVERRPVPLAELRRYLIRSFEPIAVERKLGFAIRIGDDVPATLTTDLTRLEQILKNLLSNAFKFTHEGQVELRIRYEPGAQEVAFTVSDTGIGIPREKQQLIFEAFQQADASTSRTYGGTGLGLTISRELARLLGGALSLESTPGVGSTFTLRLPLADKDLAPLPAEQLAGVFERTHRHEEAPAIEALARPPEGGRGHMLDGRRILVVDDDTRNLFAVTSLLERCGAEVTPAVNAHEAIAALQRPNGIELVLLDIMMPEMDGYQAARAIRARAGQERLPIVALTAKAMPGDREKCLEAGCNEFLAKPVDGDALLEAIGRLLPLEDAVTAGLEKASILLVDDIPANLVALEAILEDPGYELVRARSGEEALGHVLRHDFAVILLDVAMPRMDGFETARLLKERERSSRVPIIFVTASVFDLEHIFRGYKVGAVDYLRKPLDPFAVRSKVSVFVELSRQQRQLVRQGERLVEAERRARAFEQQASEQRWATTLRCIGDGVIATDAEGRITFMNPVAEAITGFTHGEARGRVLHDIFPLIDEETGQTSESPVTRVMREGGNVALGSNMSLVGREGRRFAIEDSGAPIRDQTGRLLGAVMVFRDVTERRREDERRRFLAEATTAFLSSLDVRETLGSVARLAVPRLADWCLVDLVEESGEVSEVAAAAREETLLDHGREVRRRWPARADHPIRRVVASGHPLLLGEIDEELLEQLAGDADHVEALRHLNARSAVIVPMPARGHVLGTITMVRSSGRPRYDANDLATAEELAHRAGIAVENARLYTGAQEAVRLRDEFLSVASHELRTPLTSLLLQLQTLDKLFHRLPAPDPRLGRKIENAVRQSDRLASLIDRLLDVSRISTGRLQLQLEDLDLAEVVRDVVDRFRPECTRAGCRLDLGVEPAPGRWDRLRIEQVVTNLLSNAVKYGRGQPIEIRVGPVGDRARLTVRDHGIGIGADAASRIFDRFERAVSVRQYGGLGLGLYVARQIAEAHGGTIRVESRQGAGALFVVELPQEAHASTSATKH